LLLVTLREYVDVARDRWRFVLAGLLLGLLVAGVVTVLVPREYSASVTLIVSSTAASDDPGAIAEGEALSAQRVRTYVELMRSRRLAADVVQALDLGVAPEELASRITATSAPETVLLTAQVTGETPERAIEIANVVAAQFIKNVAEIEQPADPVRVPPVEAKVFEPAAPPAVLAAPRPVLYLGLGAVLGLLVGFGAALLRSGLDTSLKRREQLEEVLEAPVVGVIGRDSKIASSPLVVYGDPQAPLAEAFRQLRTNVQFMDVDSEHKVILVTSASPSEGKSTTVCNLGLALAEAGTSVLIIDADLRRPTVARCLGVDGSIGLTNVLVNRVSVERAVQPLAPALDVLPSGLMPPNPSELLGSDRMVNLLAGLRGSYDVILIDTSPLLPVTDAAVLAPRADGVLVMVRHGKTRVQDLQAAKDALDAVSGRVLGSVMTMTPHVSKQRYASNAPNGWKQRGDAGSFAVRNGARRPSGEAVSAEKRPAGVGPAGGGPAAVVPAPAAPADGVPTERTQLVERGNDKAAR
jgi:capsular exopolysaccharide synthesis family protein